jgi:hypothetical protein
MGVQAAGNHAGLATTIGLNILERLDNCFNNLYHCFLCIFIKFRFTNGRGRR